MKNADLPPTKVLPDHHQRHRRPDHGYGSSSHPFEGAPSASKRTKLQPVRQPEDRLTSPPATNQPVGEASLHPSSNVSLSWDYYFASLLFVSYYMGLFLRIIRAYYAVSSISLNGLLFNHIYIITGTTTTRDSVTVDYRLELELLYLLSGSPSVVIVSVDPSPSPSYSPRCPGFPHPIALPNERSTSCSPNASDLGRVPDDSCSVSGPLVPPSALELNLNSSLSYYSTRDSC